MVHFRIVESQVISVTDPNLEEEEEEVAWIAA